MSIPIKYCVLVAAVDDPDVFRRIHPVMKINIDMGHFTVAPCDCDPPCRVLTDDECESLHRRLSAPV
jgi:hypothetical protein